MIRLLDDLPDLESRLLMYAAGELSSEDAEAVERELAEDPRAAARLEAICGLMAGADARLSGADESEPVAGRVLERTRYRASQQVAGWIQRRQLAAEQNDLRQGVVWRYARYPLAAAAALVVGLLLWHHASEPLPIGGLAQVDPIAGEEGAGNLPVARAERDSLANTNLERAASLFELPGDGGELTLVQLDLRSNLAAELQTLRLLSPDNWD